MIVIDRNRVYHLWVSRFLGLLQFCYTSTAQNCVHFPRLVYNSYMNTKFKCFLKKINYFRASRFYDRRWNEMGAIIQINGGLFGNKIETDLEAKQRAEHHSKRSNWIQNVWLGRPAFGK